MTLTYPRFSEGEIGINVSKFTGKISKVVDFLEKIPVIGEVAIKPVTEEFPVVRRALNIVRDTLKLSGIDPDSEIGGIDREAEWKYSRSNNRRDGNQDFSANMIQPDISSVQNIGITAPHWNHEASVSYAGSNASQYQQG